MTHRHGPDPDKWVEQEKARLERWAPLRKILQLILPYWVAVIATFVTIVLAVLPILMDVQTIYSPEVAVTAVTAVAIIWYTAVNWESVSQTKRFQWRERRRELETLRQLSHQFSDHLEEIPQQPDTVRDLQKIGVWSETDVGRLAELAPVAGPDSSQYASRAVNNLRWLGRHIRAVQVPDQKQASIAFQQINKGEWANRLSDAKNQVGSIGSENLLAAIELGFDRKSYPID